MFCKSCGNEIKDTAKFCTRCGIEVHGPQTKTGGNFFGKKKSNRKKIVLSGILAFILISAVSLFFYYRKAPTGGQTDQDIASAIVNIYCEGATTQDATTGGSGTIFSEDGLVLTNAHIIPAGGKKCVVILPDPTSGAPKEIYNAYPIVVPMLSEKYDLAFVQIHDVYYDPKEGKAYGEYPKKFPAYDSNRYCKNENVKLGEPVRIYGYPALSGGYALTVTDGIVSSLLPKEGFIITSAKISHGNSGGLAVDKNGCRIGIPSMVTGDENESLGIIISNNLISNFVSEARAVIN